MRKLKLLLTVLAVLLTVSALSVFTGAASADAGLSIKTFSLALEDAVYINFKVQKTNVPDGTDVQMLVWEEAPAEYKKGTEDACLRSYGEESGTGYELFRYKNLSAKEMTKMVYVCAYAEVDGEAVYSNPAKFSVAMYAYLQKNAARPDAELVKLLDSMLAYGAMAQTYFDYNTDHLATEAIYQVTVVDGRLDDGFSKGWFEDGDTVTLTAEETLNGKIFSHWENSAGASIGSSTSIDIIVNKTEKYTAKYVVDIHSHVEVIDESIAPTCTETGLTEGKHCSVCGEVIVAQTVVDALGHTEVIDAAIAPTCTETGLTEGKHCSVCGEVIVAQTVVDALGHTEVIDAAVSPTCIETGLTEGKHCSVCDAVIVAQEVLDMTGHTEMNVPAKAATCDQTGYEGEVKCSVCDHVITKRTVIPALGHTYSNNACTVCDHYIVPSSGLKFSLLADGTYAVTGIGTCSDKDVVIPANYNGKKVTQIGASAFSGFSGNGIYIPGTVKTISTSAFAGVSAEYIYMEEGVTTVGRSAFTGNYGSIRLMVIPSTLDSVGSEAFMCGAKCVVISSAYVARNVKTYDSMGYLLFHSQSVLVKDGLDVGSYVRDGRSYTDTVQFMGEDYIAYHPHAVANHSYDTFSTPFWQGVRCTSCYCVCDFQEKIYDASATVDDSVTARLYMEDGKIKLSLSGKGNVGTGVSTSIPWSAYTYAISEVTIGDGILSIPRYAFQYSAISSITIPDSVTSIGTYAFAYCYDLETITVGSGVTLIEDSSFSGVEFSSIQVSQANTAYCTIDGNLYTKDGKTLVLYAKRKTETAFAIPEGVTTIYYNAFSGSDLEEITIPSSVTTIHRGAFECKNIKSIYIPASVTVIDSYAFYDTTLIFCEVTSIPSGWSSGWSDYNENVIWGVLDFGTTDDGFAWIKNADGIKITGYTGAASALTFPSKINGETVTAISDVAFKNNTALTSVTIPEGVTRIGASAFEGCTSLISVYLPNSVTVMGERVFAGCSNLTGITLPNSITDIPTYAFANCSALNTITIPSNVKAIKNYAFYQCKALTTVECESTSMLETIGESAFYYCTSLNSITIPDSVKVLEESAFSGCSKLKSISLPSGIEVIESYALPPSLTYTVYNGASYIGNSENPYLVVVKKNDSTITTFSIHPDTKIIYGSAFSSCINLTSVTIPSGVRYIGEYAFNYCSSLRYVDIPISVVYVDYFAFYNCSSLYRIYCEAPQSTYNFYKPSGATIYWNVAMS